jgi:hypothetical protein
MRQGSKVSYQILRPWAERQVDSALGAEEVRHERESSALDAMEQKRRSSLSNDSAMNLGCFLIGIDLRVDVDNLGVLAQDFDERLKIPDHGVQ